MTDIYVYSQTSASGASGTYTCRIWKGGNLSIKSKRFEHTTSNQLELHAAIDVLEGLGGKHRITFHQRTHFANQTIQPFRPLDRKKRVFCGAFHRRIHERVAENCANIC